VIRRSTEGVAASVTRRPTTDAARARATQTYADDRADSLLPPEPDTSELVVRATHVEAPPITDDVPAAADPDEHDPSAPDGETGRGAPQPGAGRGAAGPEAGRGAAGFEAARGAAGPEGGEPNPADLTPQGRY